MPSDFTPNNVWGSNPSEGSEEELTLPSGQTCRARKVTITSLIEAGIMNEADSLTAMVDQHTRKIKGGKVADGTPVLDQSILRDSSAISAMIMMADRALPSIVVSPPVSLHFTETVVGRTKVTKKIPESERNAMRLVQPGLVFTDQIDLEDKMHLFEWGVGGLKAFSSFRADTPSDVGDLVPREGGKGPAKRRPRNR
jgi:hypothetical protein